MNHWVYIYEDEKSSLRIALKTSDDNNLSNLLLNKPIVYLRPFEIPFDAIAHKHLLDDLSKRVCFELDTQAHRRDREMVEIALWERLFYKLSDQLY